MDAPKMVIEQVSPSHRRYHVNAKFSCDLQGVIASEQMHDAIREAESGEPSHLLTKLFEERPQCSLGAALDELEHCHHDHHGELGIVEATINLARADWSVMHKKVVKIIATSLGWNGYIEQVVVK